MSEFLEKLQERSEKIKKMDNELLELKRKYRKILDGSIRQDIFELERKTKKEKSNLVMFLYENIPELKLIKKHYPKFFTELETDIGIGRSLCKMKWILEFEPNKNAKEELEKIIKIQQDAGNAGKNKIEKRDPKLRKKKFLLILNEPIIDRYLKRYMKKYFAHLDAEKKLEEKYESKKMHIGSVELNKIQEEIISEKKNIKRYEKLMKKILYSNPEHLKKLKSTKITGSFYSAREHQFLDSVQNKNIDEIKWVEQMDRILKN
ncbi:MAG: hypothetical protein WC501_03870 [Candidatus Micrarchaeia archaeon]